MCQALHDKMNVFGYPTQYRSMTWDYFGLDLNIHWSHLSLSCLPLCSCQLLAQMFVCILMGREWRRSTSTLCRTTPSSSWCPEVRPGAEEVKTHPSDQALNVLIFQITPAPFKSQSCTTSACCSARAHTAVSSSRRQRSCCLVMSTLIRSVKSCPTCCWTSRTNLSWRAETTTRAGSKVQCSADTVGTQQNKLLKLQGDEGMNSFSTSWCQRGPLERQNSRLFGRLHHLCNF